MNTIIVVKLTEQHSEAESMKDERRLTKVGVRPYAGLNTEEAATGNGKQKVCACAVLLNLQVTLCPTGVIHCNAPVYWAFYKAVLFAYVQYLLQPIPFCQVSLDP